MTVEELVRKVSAFREADGVLTWDVWERASAAERAAFVAVARRLRVEQAVRIGTAAKGAEGVLEVVAELDGGQRLEEARMRQAVRVAAEQARGGA